MFLFYAFEHFLVKPIDNHWSYEILSLQKEKLFLSAPSRHISYRLGLRRHKA